jgi:hypothetical protein
VTGVLQGLIEAARPFPAELGLGNGQPVPAQIPDRNIRERHATVVVTGHDPSERRAQLIHHR